METAEATLRAARTKYEQLLGGGAPTDQRTADAAVDAARASLQQAEAKRDGLRTPAPAAVAAAQAAVASAEEKLRSLAQQLDLVAGPQAQAQHAAAAAAVQKAQDDAQRASAPGCRGGRGAARGGGPGPGAARPEEPALRPEEMAEAQAAVEQARAAYALARDAEGRGVRVRARVRYRRGPPTGARRAGLSERAGLPEPLDRNRCARTTWRSGPKSTSSALDGLRPDRPATLTVDAYPDQPIDAQVDVVLPSADPGSHTFQVRLVPASGEGLLRDGTLVQVRLSRS